MQSDLVFDLMSAQKQHIIVAWKVVVGYEVFLQTIWSEHTSQQTNQILYFF